MFDISKRIGYLMRETAEGTWGYSKKKFRNKLSNKQKEKGTI